MIDSDSTSDTLFPIHPLLKIKKRWILKLVRIQNLLSLFLEAVGWKLGENFYQIDWKRNFIHFVVIVYHLDMIRCIWKHFLVCSSEFMMQFMKWRFLSIIEKVFKFQIVVFWKLNKLSHLIFAVQLTELFLLILKTFVKINFWWKGYQISDIKLWNLNSFFLKMLCDDLHACLANYL